MSTATRLAGFVAVLVVAVLGAYVVGDAVGPIGTAPAEAPHSTGH